jgi:type IX secretion system PorP/SprF family membrane protein
MNNIKYIIFCLLAVLGCNSFAQDPSFSQFYFNQTYFNPAYVGYHGGTMLNATYRRQWIKLPGKFETKYFNIDSDISSINGLGGIGLTAYTDMEGDGFLSTTGADVMLSLRFPTNSSKRYSYKEVFFIQPAFGIGIMQKNIDFSKFTFGDQLDPITKKIDPYTAFKYPLDHDIIFPDFKFGVLLKYGKGPMKGIEVRENWDIRFGFAVHHLFEPNQSFLGQTSRLPRKLVVHLNSNISLNRDADMIFAPCVVWEHQAQMNTILGGCNFLWKNIFIGGWYRAFNNSDALIFDFGLIVGPDRKHSNKYKFYYSYDMTISNLSNSATGGSHEISISFYFDNSLNELKIGGKKHKKREKIPCPAPNIYSF